MIDAAGWMGSAARWVVAYTAAVLGDVGYFLVLTWAAAEAGGPRLSGLILAVGAIPRALLMLPGGVLADRVDPRRIAIGTDALRALILLLAAGAASWFGLVPWWLAVVAIGFGMVDACFIPAVGAMPPRLVSAEILPRLQAWRLTGLRVGNAVGPALGAVLIMVGIPGALAAIAVLFAISVALLLTVRSRRVDAEAPEGNALPSLTAPLPLSQLRRHGLLPLIVGTALSDLPFSGPIAIGIVLLVQERGWSVAAAGGVLAAFSVGGLVASVLMALLPLRPPGKGTTLAALAVSALLLGLLGATREATSAIVVGALLGATTGTAMVICHGKIQQSTPPALLGRVTALLSLATLGLSPLTYGAAGAIAAAWGAGVFFALAAGVLVLAGLTLARARFSAPLDSSLLRGSDAESSRWDHRAMTGTWDERIDSFWSTADDAQPDAALRSMRALVEERAEDDPDALYEWASVHDYLGMEQQAVPLYRAALDHGLGGTRRPQAIIQLASSLRNVGEPEVAVELLRQRQSDEVVGDAAQAFLALALRDSGRHDEALATALLALAPTLPLYRRAIERYAADIGEQGTPHR